MHLYLYTISAICSLYIPTCISILALYRTGCRASLTCRRSYRIMAPGHVRGATWKLSSYSFLDLSPYTWEITFRLPIAIVLSYSLNIMDALLSFS